MSPSESHPALCAAVRERMAREPRDRLGSDFLHDDTDAYWQWTRDLSRALAREGWLTMHWPREWGGESAPLDRVAAWREAYSRAGGPNTHGVISGVTRLAGPLLAHGTREQQERWLPAIARGDLSCAMANSEDHAGSDLSAIALTARRDGSGYVLDGVKRWISYGHRCDVILVLARTGDPESGHRGLSQFIVPGDAPGLVRTAHPNLSGGHPVADLTFNQVRVGLESRLGTEGEGWRILHDPSWRGEVSVAFPATARYEFDRFVALGLDVPAMELGRLELEIEAWRQLAWRALVDPSLDSLAILWGKEWEPTFARKLLEWAGPAAWSDGPFARYRRLYWAAEGNHARYTPEALKQVIALERYGLC